MSPVRFSFLRFAYLNLCCNIRVLPWRGDGFSLGNIAFSSLHAIAHFCNLYIISGNRHSKKCITIRKPSGIWRFLVSLGRPPKRAVNRSGIRLTRHTSGSDGVHGSMRNETDTLCSSGERCCFNGSRLSEQVQTRRGNLVSEIFIIAVPSHNSFSSPQLRYSLSRATLALHLIPESELQSALVPSLSVTSLWVKQIIKKSDIN